MRAAAQSPRARAADGRGAGARSAGAAAAGSAPAGGRKAGGPPGAGGKSAGRRGGGGIPAGRPSGADTRRSGRARTAGARGSAAAAGQRAAGRWFAVAAARKAAAQAAREPGGTAIAGMDVLRRPVAYTPRRGTGLTGYERVLMRAGLGPVAGIDEAGRGACAGPLVVAAVAIDRCDSETLSGIADSKALTARAREAAYRKIVRAALAWHVVVIEPDEIDRLGLHVCNVAGMRRALAGLRVSPGYVLTDGFEVPGLAAPALAMWKGDQVAACVAAASIVAKVTRDKIMTSLHLRYPEYGFARHKGYSTPSHMAALDSCGASPVHRRSFVNVSSRVTGARTPGGLVVPAAGIEDLEQAGGVVLADGSVLAVEDGDDGPIVELAVDSPADAPPAAACPGQASAGQASAGRWPASSEGRT